MLFYGTKQYFYTMAKYLPAKICYCDKIYTKADKMIYNRSTVTPIHKFQTNVDYLLFY